MASKVKVLSKHGSLVLAGRMYSKINRLYYDGSLPKCRFKIKPIGWAWGYTYNLATGPIIQMAPYIARYRDLLVQLLIHEIVHVAHPDWDHGDKFEAKMMDIRKKCFSEQLY